MWEVLGNPAEPANTLPGGTYNSAGGRPADVTWKDAFSFKHEGNAYAWYQAPCARDSLLVGMGAGGAAGGLRFILKGASLVLGPFCCTPGLISDRAFLHVDNRQFRRRRLRSVSIWNVLLV
jgi:hypothetical protein